MCLETGLFHPGREISPGHFGGGSEEATLSSAALHDIGAQVCVVARQRPRSCRFWRKLHESIAYRRELGPGWGFP